MFLDKKKIHFVNTFIYLPIFKAKVQLVIGYGNVGNCSSRPIYNAVLCTVWKEWDCLLKFKILTAIKQLDFFASVFEKKPQNLS